MERYTIKQFHAQFPDDDACLDFLKNARWPNGVTCSKCERVTGHYRIAGRKVYSCEFCGTQVSPTADTIFHKSATSLKSWFHATFLIASTRTGISATQLERELGVTYKTASRMFKQIRSLIAQDDIVLFGDVEVDETYIEGRRPGKRGRGAYRRTIVARMVERGGGAVLKIGPNVKAKDYVAGRTHANNIEEMWSNVKRRIDGVHHAVSHKHLDAAYVYRFNHRNDSTPMFSQLLGKAACG